MREDKREHVLDPWSFESNGEWVLHKLTTIDPVSLTIYKWLLILTIWSLFILKLILQLGLSVLMQLIKRQQLAHIFKFLAAVWSLWRTLSQAAVAVSCLLEERQQCTSEWLVFFLLISASLLSSRQEDRSHSFNCVCSNKEETGRARPPLISLAQTLVVNGKC